MAAIFRTRNLWSRQADGLRNSIEPSEQAGGAALALFAGPSGSLASPSPHSSAGPPGPSALVLNGTPGDDTLTGTPDADTLNGLGGNDILDGRRGVDTLAGGTGADRFVFSTPIAIDTADVITDFSVSEDMIELIAGFGSPFPSLTPGPLPASAFNIDFQGTTAETRIIYYSGILYYDIDGAGGRDAVPFTQLQAGLALTAAHFVVGYNGSPQPQATEGNDVMIGSPEDDYFSALGGDDVLDGRAGADVLIGGLGNDTYHTEGSGNPAVFDRIVERSGEGTDTILTAGDYVMQDDQHIEILRTSDDSGTATINLAGNRYNNTIYGNAGENNLYGNDGDDFLFGWRGLNLLYGGPGNDTYHIGYSASFVYENSNEGTDRILSAADYTIPDNISVEMLSTDFHAGTAPIALGGNVLDNVIYGNAGNNILYGKGGNDWLEGLGGNDQYYVDSAGDYVREVAGGGADRILAGGDYTLYAGQSIEILSTDHNAGTAAIALGGNELDNTIYGNDGANILYGKEGNDTLMGLGGNDRFWFNTALGAANVDTIYGFASGADKMVLFQSVFAALTPGGLSASAFVTGSAAQDADDRIVYNNATGALLYDSDGNGTGAAIQFATLNGAPALAASDFIIF